MNVVGKRRFHSCLPTLDSLAFVLTHSDFIFTRIRIFLSRLSELRRINRRQGKFRGSLEVRRLNLHEEKCYVTNKFKFTIADFYISVLRSGVFNFGGRRGGLRRRREDRCCRVSPVKRHLIFESQSTRFYRHVLRHLDGHSCACPLRRRRQSRSYSLLETEFGI